jgi:aminoglycoside N3'-acetyltransferase
MIIKVKNYLKRFNSQNLLIHSDIFHGFQSNTLSSRKDILDFNINCLKEIASSKNLIFPSFNYNFLKTGKYSMSDDISQVGVLSEYFRKKISLYRSNEPVFNFSSLNKLNYFRNDNVIDPFDENSFFDFMLNSNTVLIHYGSKFSTSTFLHYIERSLGKVPYRYDKIFYGKTCLNNGISNKVALKYHVRPMNCYLDYRFNEIESELINNGLMKKFCDNNTSLLIISLKDMYEFIINNLKINPFYLLDLKSKEWIIPKVEKLGRGFLLKDFEI